MVRPGKNERTEDELHEERMKRAMLDIVRKFPHVAKKQDKVNESLQALRDHRNEGNVYNSRNKPRQDALVGTALKACESEVDTIKKMLADIQKIRRFDTKHKMHSRLRRHDLMHVLSEQASSLPLYICGLEPFPPGGVGAIAFPEGHILEEGDNCAAFVDDNWILGEVVSYTTSGKYEVRDIEEDTKLNMVPKKKVIALPSYRADPVRHSYALFPMDAIVLALYPQTTCFYKGCVISTPKTATEDYSIAFEDATYPDGWSPPLPVPQRYVLQHKEVKSKKKQIDDDV